MAMTREEILQAIKEKILSIVPDADIMLFGSRARGDWHKESDWDILVLTKETVDYKLRDRVYDAVYPVSLETLSVVSPTIANKNEWRKHPGWYCLSTSIKDELVAI